MKDMLQTIVVHSLVRQTMVMYISARVNKHVTARGAATLSLLILLMSFNQVVLKIYVCTARQNFSV